VTSFFNIIKSSLLVVIVVVVVVVAVVAGVRPPQHFETPLVKIKNVFLKEINFETHRGWRVHTVQYGVLI
jgi:hypothetical protein